MSQDYSKLSIEDRLARLEARSEKHATAVKALTTMVIFKDASPFDPPLKQFFDDAENFFDDIQQDAAGCYNQCFHAMLRDLKAAGEDEAKRKQARDAHDRCIAGCPPLNP